MDDLKEFNVELIKQSNFETPEQVRQKIQTRVEARLGNRLHLSQEPLFGSEPDLAVSTAFIKAGNKFLLLQRSAAEEQKMKWGIPGGKVEEGETALEALKREVLEETGLVTQDLSIKHLGNFYAQHTKYYYKLFVYFIDLGEFTAPEISLQPTEHSDYVWAPLDSLGDYPLMLGQDEIICLMKDSLQNI